jgi:aspartate racemase
MKTIGILGGMGPEATADFFSKLVAADKAKKDQDHLHIIVESDPSIPDRTAFILGNGEDPLPAMLRSARRLVDAGADILAIPCMTAHAFLPGLRRLVSIPFFSALEAMNRELRDHFSSVDTLGVLATIGSRKAGIYESNFPGYTVLWPSEIIHTTKVMEAVYGPEGIKAGIRGEAPRNLLIDAAKSLKDEGANAIVAGCTEIPLVLAQSDLDLPFIDPMAIMAKQLAAFARRG